MQRSCDRQKLVYSGRLEKRQQMLEGRGSSKGKPVTEIWGARGERLRWGSSSSWSCSWVVPSPAMYLKDVLFVPCFKLQRIETGVAGPLSTDISSLLSLSQSLPLAVWSHLGWRRTTTCGT